MPRYARNDVLYGYRVHGSYLPEAGYRMLIDLPQQPLEPNPMIFGVQANDPGLAVRQVAERLDQAVADHIDPVDRITLAIDNLFRQKALAFASRQK